MSDDQTVALLERIAQSLESIDTRLEEMSSTLLSVDSSAADIKNDVNSTLWDIRWKIEAIGS